MSPKAAVPYNELGSALDEGFFSTHGELLDRGDPTPDQLQYMIEHDAQAQALEWALTGPLQSAAFTIEEGEDDSGEADFCRGILLESPHAGGMQTPINEVIAQMTSAITLKRAHFELVWVPNEDNTKAVIDKIAYRPISTCTLLVDDDGALSGFKQRGMKPDGKPFVLDFLLKDRKAFIYIHRNYKKPLEGMSAFQTAYGEYVDKLKVNRLHNIHLQNFALGTVIAKYAGSVKDAARKFFRKIKKFAGGGGVIVLGGDEEVKFESKTGAGAEFIEKIRYHDTQMAGSLMLKFLQLGTDSNTGAWALSRDHSDFYLQLLQAILDDVGYTLTKEILGNLVEVNFGKDASFPKFVFHDLAEDTLQRAYEAYLALAAVTNPVQGPLIQLVAEKFAQRLEIDPEKLEELQKEQGTLTSQPIKGLTPEQQQAATGNGQGAVSQEASNGQSGGAPNGVPVPGGGGGDASNNALVRSLQALMTPDNTNGGG